MEEIRITSGIYRGRRIKSPRSFLTHPMGSREKIALFNMINEFLPGASVLDAYSGSGALGIEALSRGAREVVFIEKSPKVSQIIKENIKNLRLSNGEVINTDVKNYKADKTFDVILADPPYDKFVVQDILGLTKYIKDGGVLVLSHPGSPPVISELKLTNTKRYAGASISIYQKNA